MNYIIAIRTLFQSNSLKLSERSQILDGEFDFAVESLPSYEQIKELSCHFLKEMILQFL